MNLLLKKNTAKHIQLSTKEFEQYCSFFQQKKIPKKDFFLKQGQTCKYEGFVIKGCFRIFTLDKNGNEHVLYFAIKDWWISDIDSFTNQIASSLSIQALEDSEILIISKENKDKVFLEIPKIEKLFRIMTQKFLVSNQRRIIQNHSLSAKQRYEYFLVTYPQISSKLTNLQLASYLGISHEFLSKIKKRLRKD